MDLDQTLKDGRLFLLFSLTLMTVVKSNRLLMEGGADPIAIRHINKAIELIAKQLDEAAVRLETEYQALKNVDDLSRDLGIARADAQGDDSDSDE